MSRQKRVFLSAIPIFLTLVMLLLLLPSCGGSSQTAAKKLVIAINTSGENYDILSSGASYPNVVAVADNVYEYYLSREPSATGNGKVVPGICESWIVSPDGKMIQFTLRKGVKFQSGDPLTTADVLFSYDRGMKDSFVKGIYTTVDHLEAVDDYTFKVYFKTADVSFIPGLGYPVGSKTYYDRVGEAEFVKHPVGTGPYKIVNFQSGQYIDLQAFDGYWGGAPAIKDVRFAFAPEDSTRVAMLKTGEADMITQVPYPLVSDINKTKGLKTVGTAAGNRTVFMKFQNVSPKTPWYDIRVRQAYAIAINRAAIVNDVEYGLVESYPALEPGDIGYDSTLQQYEYNPTKAKQLLADAGYPNGLDITLNYMNGEVYGLKDTTTAVASYLNAAGFKVNLVAWDPPQWAQYNSKASGNGTMDYISLGIAGIAGVADSTSGLFNQYSTVTPYAGYFNKPVNDLAVQVRATMDDNARADLIKKAWGLIRADYAYVPLFTAARIYGMKDNLSYTPSSRGTGHEVVFIKDIKVK